jgi:hypothetical protein
MISTLLRTAAVVCSLIIAISFLLFVIDQTKGSETNAVQEIQGVQHPVGPPPKPVHQPRKFIDHAAHDLTTPFNGLVDNKGAWVRHIVPDLLGVLLFGLGLGYLARVVSDRG